MGQHGGTVTFGSGGKKKVHIWSRSIRRGNASYIGPFPCTCCCFYVLFLSAAFFQSGIFYTAVSDVSDFFCSSLQVSVNNSVSLMSLRRLKSVVRPSYMHPSELVTFSWVAVFLSGAYFFAICLLESMEHLLDGSRHTWPLCLAHILY